LRIFDHKKIIFLAQIEQISLGLGKDLGKSFYSFLTNSCFSFENCIHFSDGSSTLVKLTLKALKALEWIL